MKFVIIIPARFASKRLPGKPLKLIKKIPMIVRTYNQCAQVCSVKQIFVATDDIRIMNICSKHNISTVLTSKKCLTGTDRVAEVSRKVDADYYINVQGDEPVINPNDIKKIINSLNKYPSEILNGYTKISKNSEYIDRNVPKVSFNLEKILLYMSRSPIPGNKANIMRNAYRQVCIYSYPRKLLKKFYRQGKKTPLEKIEDIEILRFLELGMTVRMIPMTNKSIPVDNYRDLKKVSKVVK